MDQYETIRTGYRVYGQNIIEMARMTGHSRNTIKKAIRGEPWAVLGTSMIRNVKRKSEISHNPPGCRQWFNKTPFPPSGLFILSNGPTWRSGDQTSICGIRSQMPSKAPRYPANEVSINSDGFDVRAENGPSNRARRRRATT